MKRRGPMVDAELSKEVDTIITAIGDSQDDGMDGFTVLRVALIYLQEQFAGKISRSTALWHLKRLRNEAIAIDVRRSGDTD